jgi:hypothetical protein
MAIRNIANCELTFDGRITTLIPEGSNVPQKPTRPTASAKNETGDFGKFKNFMQRLVAVPHSEIKAKLDAEKRAKKRNRPSKASASGHASNEKD